MPRDVRDHRGDEFVSRAKLIPPARRLVAVVQLMPKIGRIVSMQNGGAAIFCNLTRRGIGVSCGGRDEPRFLALLGMTNAESRRGLLQQPKHPDTVSCSHVHLAVRDHRGDEFVSRAKLIPPA